MNLEEQFGQLVDLYQRNQFGEMVAQAERLASEYPSSYPIWNILAAGQKALGHLAEAERGFRIAAMLNPTFAEAQYNLGIVLHDQQNFDEAISAYKRACDLNPDHAVAYFNMGNTFRAKGEFSNAISAFRRAVEINQHYSEAHNNLGNTLKEQGETKAAISAYERAIQSNPTYLEAYKNYALALTMDGHGERAISVYLHAIKMAPTDVTLHKSLGHLLRNQGRPSDAVVIYRRAMELTPADFDICMGLGQALRDQGETGQAITAYRRATEIKPESADAHNNLGVSLADTGKTEDAIAAYEVAHRLNPEFAEAYNNLGNALNAQSRFSEAVSAYRRSIEINPDYSDAYSNMGTALRNLGRSEEEFSAYRRAIELNPSNAVAHNNMASALSQIGKHAPAISAYQRALEINPNDAAVKAQLLHQQQQICDFRNSDELEAASAHLGIQTEAVPPFLALGWADRPDHQRDRATKWAKAQKRSDPDRLATRSKNSGEKLRVGLFSADIRPHPMMYCLAGLLRNYDRSALEFYVYNLHRGHAGDWPKTVKAQVDHYVQAEHLSDADLIKRTLADDLDILIDLTGYTAGNRCTVIQSRLAPIQINFLGFPGTMGADFIDYIIADTVVIPEDLRHFYSEKVIYLPHSYFPIDYALVERAPATNRAEHGLPEEAFVFCCFNSNYKIGRQEFAIWMRILGKVEHSVLWLLGSNPWAEENLRKEAQIANIDPARLIFAAKVTIAEHLERHRHADLFLDTFNYNAHTTACDALWTGVPVVTKIGRQFSARVAASLLRTVGLPELITSTDSDYETTLLRLAQGPDELAYLKSKLRNAVAVSALFDSKRYTRAFENGLRAAHDHISAGRAAENIWVFDADS